MQRDRIPAIKTRTSSIINHCSLNHVTCMKNHQFERTVFALQGLLSSLERQHQGQLDVPIYTRLKLLLRAWSNITPPRQQEQNACNKMAFGAYILRVGWTLKRCCVGLLVTSTGSGNLLSFEYKGTPLDC